jgi:hypothetical protein
MENVEKLLSPYKSDDHLLTHFISILLDTDNDATSLHVLLEPWDIPFELINFVVEKRDLHEQHQDKNTHIRRHQYSQRPCPNKYYCE